MGFRMLGMPWSPLGSPLGSGLLRRRGGVSVSLLPMAFTFTGANDTTLASLGFTAGAHWTIQSNAANAAPTLGSERVTNGGFEGTYDDESGGGGGTVNVAANWNAYTVETDGSDTLDESATAHGGSKSQLINVTAHAEGIESSGAIFLTAGWYVASAHIYGTSGGVRFDVNSPFLVDETYTPAAGSWTRYGWLDYKPDGVGRRMYIRANGGAANFLVDDVSGKTVTFSDLIAVVDAEQPNVICYADITISSNSPTGLILCLDNASTPANFLYAYHDGIYARLLKVVGGTKTSLIKVATAYSAGATLKVTTTTSGANLLVNLQYNSAAVGTQQTVSNAGIVSNTLQGILSTLTGNTIDNFTVEAN